MFNNWNRETSLEALSFPNLLCNEDCIKPYVEKTCSTAVEEAVAIKSCNIAFSAFFVQNLHLSPWNELSTSHGD